jgi:cobalamin biosynthesis protein CobT
MGGRKAEVARDTVVALTECLEGARMPYKIVGFCNKTWGQQREAKGQYHRKTATDTVVFKDFEHPLRLCKGAIAQLPGAVGGDNSDYDFIAQELSILSKRPERRKVLFVLSDGHPAHASDASRPEIIRHCKEAIDKAGKNGVECIGIGICDEAVKEIYKDNVVVHDVKDLSGAVFNKLTNTLVGR